MLIRQRNGAYVRGSDFSAMNEAEHALQRALFCLNRGALTDSVAHAERATALLPGNGFAPLLLGVAIEISRQPNCAR
jgi:hypothetical protein